MLPSRRTISRALYAVYLAAAVLALDYFFFYRPFVAGIRDAPRADLTPPRHVERETMRRLGTLRGDRSSSFTRYEVAKRSGTTRLCALGDSFTYGDETADGHDYPAFLEILANRAGIGAVEVLNFGNSWYGFHQAFVVWEEIARRFACDAILLGPDCFQPDRDTTFHHGGDGHPYYLHARYVLDGDGVRLVEVDGATNEERFDRYFSFVPRLRYLRYDRNAPAFLQALAPTRPSRINPFYYRRSDALTEAHATYVRLLTAMADAGPPIVVLHSLGPIVDMVDGLARDDVIGVDARRLTRFPYSAPGGHYSAFGNRWLAEQYLAALTGGGRVTVLELGDAAEGAVRDPAAPGGSSARPAPVSSFERVIVALAGERAGFLAAMSASPSARGGTSDDFHGTEVASLVALQPAGRSVFHGAFLPLPFDATDGAVVLARLHEGGREPAEIELGRVALPQPAVLLGVARIAGLDALDVLAFGGNDALPAARLEAAAQIEIVIDGHVVLAGRGGSSPVVLEPLGRPLRGARAGAGDYVDVDALATSGPVQLVFVSPDATRLAVDLSRWHKVEAEPYALPPSARRPLRQVPR